MTKLKIKSNESARTFTIRKYVNGKFLTKYRTIKFNKIEFEDLEINTENDWKQFLYNNKNEYTIIK